MFIDWWRSVSVMVHLWRISNYYVFGSRRDRAECHLIYTSAKGLIALLLILENIKEVCNRTLIEIVTNF